MSVRTASGITTTITREDATRKTLVQAYRLRNTAGWTMQASAAAMAMFRTSIPAGTSDAQLSVAQQVESRM